MNDNHCTNASDQVASSEKAVVPKYRDIKNRFIRCFVYSLLIIIPVAGILYVLGLHQTLRINIYAEQYIGLFLGLVLGGIFLMVPASKSAPRDRIPWYDWILSVLGLNAGFYLLFFYPEIILSMGYVTTGRFVLSVIAIILILEAIRRLLGYAMLIIVSLL